MEQQVRVLTLQTNQNNETTIFRIQKGWIIQFRRGASLFGKSIELFINYPEEGKSFQRSSYRQLSWHSDSGNKADDTGLYTQVKLLVAGSFRYYFTASDSCSSLGSGYFVVDPTLTAGNEVLPLDCIQCQTVLSKNLGAFSEWKARLRVAKETGYNVVHFTPVQTLGGSNSAYSLRDHHGINVTFHSKDQKCTLSDIAKLVEEMRSQWGVLSLVDIVVNHTANESEWLQEHPEATYNTLHSPHLKTAFLVDRAIYYCSRDVALGKLASVGVPQNLSTEDHISALWHHLYHNALLPLALHEFYSVDVDSLVKQFKEKISKLPAADEGDSGALQIVQDKQYQRLQSTVDLDLAAKIYNKAMPGVGECARIENCCNAFREALLGLNSDKRNEMEGHLMAATDGTIGTVRYERVQENGPRIKEVSAEHPLAPPYFTYFSDDADIETDERLMQSDKGAFFMAHNGWIMNFDVRKNFAEEGCYVYLRRELVAWGDSVKLRYGQKPEDSPFLWDYMRKYCEDTASTFHGIRLDNCHSTPIHVAEYLLDCARKVRPDLYVIAELFTDSDAVDNVFVNRLGINSLIREAMKAGDSHEEGRLVYRYGGEPVGAFILPPVRPLMPSLAHAILLDLTHDNPSPAEKRTVFDMLPSAALVNMACCASGSNRGYDELVPHHIHVVSESRLYSSFTEKEGSLSPGEVNAASGIVRAKKLLNGLHYKLGKEGFSQVFVDQVTSHVVTVTRHNPVSHESVILVAYTSFCPPAHIGGDYLRPLTVEGSLDSVIFEVQLKASNPEDEYRQCPSQFEKDPNFINGLDGISVIVREELSLQQAQFVQKQDERPGFVSLDFTSNFRPGCVIAAKFSLAPSAQKAVESIRQTLKQFVYLPRLNELQVQDTVLQTALADLDLVALNRSLYRCHEEEQDEGQGGGVYDVPSFRRLVYCGLQGLESVMKAIRVSNDLGHPLCGNIRDGDWLLDYTWRRLETVQSTRSVGLWLMSVLEQVKKVPRYLIPSYFDAVINKLYLAFINRAWQLMSAFVGKGSLFTKQLGLCSVQFVSIVTSAPLPILSPNLAQPVPPFIEGMTIQRAPTIAAGLPHFCVGYMRNWGRDTFIALPGNLLMTGRYCEARWIILAFAGTLRHGLIPNLLDGGRKARFNCRDAVWFWLMAIQKYVEIVNDGHLILQDKVLRLFPRDDSEISPSRGVQQTLEFVIQEALTRHFQGCSFRERNAGWTIDQQMTDQGFNNCIGIDLDTGFPFGGNKWNCGTWMDKMGSSERAGNKGKPATPRDGSAVEIVGLCKAAVTFLDKMFKENKYSYQGVSRIEKDGTEVNWTYSFWSQLLLDNFQKCFYISKDSSHTDRKPEFINKKMIYKDSYKATDDWPDYQLRCNFPIALAVAPELVDPIEGLEALSVVEKVLLGPLGIKTLDSDDWQYRPNYDNSNDSAEYYVARGFNYHQGPEWLWPVGFFLRAKLALAKKVNKPELLASTVASIKSKLSRHFSHLLKEEWRSLPELTNENGQYCKDSNPAQSWSTGCLLEVLWDMRNL